MTHHHVEFSLVYFAVAMAFTVLSMASLHEGANMVLALVCTAAGMAYFTHSVVAEPARAKR